MGCVSTALTGLGSGNRRSHIPAPVQPTNIPNLAPSKAQIGKKISRTMTGKVGPLLH